MNKDTAKKVAIGTVLAAAAGYVAGVLTAPKSGKETRADIKDAAVKTLAQAEKQLKQLHTELNDLLAKAKEKAQDAKGEARAQFDKAMDAAIVAKEKARELLSAAHEGKADDADLQKAISQAKKAAEHLKTYLTK